MKILKNNRVILIEIKPSLKGNGKLISIISISIPLVVFLLW